ncbi:MAG: Maf-like protein, partial [Syntrophobacteraceae bacterium]|nr:Maf-like protein [Syntrophobacteraceae bacterium]
MSTARPGSGKLYRMLQPLILASASPRRSEMLGLMGLEFQVIPSGAEENGGVGRGGRNQVEMWAREKAAAVSKLNPNAWVLGADTVVVLDGKIFGKPADASEAREMLKELSGRTHEVLSGVCLIHGESSLSIVQSVRTLVHCRDLH